MCEMSKECEEKCAEKLMPDSNVEKQSYSWGIRHLQAFSMTVSMTVLFMVRSSMGVAVLAMTDRSKLNTTNVQIYQWDKNTQGLILSSFFWGYMVMQIPGGLLAKRYGGKPILLVALLANGVTCLALPIMAKTGGWICVCLARVVTGMTQACLFPASHTLIGRWLPSSERTAYTGYIYSACKIGIIIGLPVCGVISDSPYGWPMIFYVTGAVSMVTAVFWYKFAASTPGEHSMITAAEREFIERDMLLSSVQKPLTAVPWSSIMRCRQFLAIIVANFGFNIFYTFLLVDLPTYLEKGLHIPLKSSALLSATPYIGMWIGSIVCSYFIDILINKNIISVTASRKICNSIAFFGAAIGLIIISFLGTDNTALALVVLVLSFSTEGFIGCAYVANFLDLSPNYAGVLLSMSNTVGNVGGILTPLLISFTLKNDPTNISRWQTVFLIVAGLCVACNLIYICFGDCERQPWDDPDFKEKKDKKKLDFDEKESLAVSDKVIEKS